MSRGTICEDKTTEEQTISKSDDERREERTLVPWSGIVSCVCSDRRTDERGDTDSRQRMKRNSAP